MKKFLLFVLLLPWLACQTTPKDPEAEALKKRQAVFGSFASDFAPMVIDTLPVFNCDEVAQSDSVESYPVADSIISGAISERLLQQAGFIREGQFDRNSMYYAKGHFPFDDSLEAYIIESYRSDNMRSTHLFIFDQKKQDFTQTHPLNFVMEGGATSWQRKAWLYDSNQDMVRDVVYILNVKAENDLGEEEFIISDSLRVEVWNGNGFTVFNDFDSYSLKSDLGLDPGEVEGSDDFDFF